MEDLETLAAMLCIVGIGVLLCLSGDYIRRKTGGRIRHAEIHLLAWIPTIALEALCLFTGRGPGTIYLFPFLVAAVVYAYFALEILGGSRSWQRSEERLDAADASIFKERRRRARIDAYKHGQKGSLPADRGNNAVGSARMRSSGAAGSRVASPRAGFDSRGAGSERPTGFAGSARTAFDGQARHAFLDLTRPRLALVMGLQCAMIVSLMMSLLLGVDIVIGLGAPFPEVFFWYAGGVALLSATAIAGLTRSVFFVIPTLVMAAALAGLIDSFRIRLSSFHQPFWIDLTHWLAYTAMLAISLVALGWATRTLFSRRE